MTIKVLIPTFLQKFTKNQSTIECGGNNIVELIEALETNCPGLKKSLCDEQGEPRRFFNFFVNNEDIRFLDDSKTELKDGDQVSIISAIAGG
jgi:molybdopterin synthase sulfur carrier subunit